MTKEDKELLLVDLCARVPYKVKVNIPIPSNIKGQSAYTGPIELTSLNLIKKDCSVGDVYSQVSGLRIYDRFGEPLIKPYLRPMSSMTEEEKKKLQEIIKSNPISPFGKLTNKCDNLTRSVAYGTFDVLSYLLSRHFDVHCLIENGLALEAPEGMYKIN